MMTKGTSWPNRIKRRNCHISICSVTYRDVTIRSFDVDWLRCKELYWIIERYILENAHWLCTWASLWNQGICSQFLGGKNHNCRSILLIGGMKHFKCFFFGLEGGVKHFCCFIENGGTKHFLKALERVWNISNFPCWGYETFLRWFFKTLRPGVQVKKWTAPYLGHVFKQQAYSRQ